MLAKPGIVAENKFDMTASEEDLSLSNQLYYIFVMTAKEKALQKLKSVQDTNGLEAWRCFHLEWELTQQGRFTAMLMGILKQDFIVSRPGSEQS